MRITPLAAAIGGLFAYAFIPIILVVALLVFGWLGIVPSLAQDAATAVDPSPWAQLLAHPQPALVTFAMAVLTPSAASSPGMPGRSAASRRR